MYTILGADGKEYGPATVDMVKNWINSGRANAQTKIRREGETEFTTIGALPEFSTSTSPTPGPAPTASGQPSPADAGKMESFEFTGKWDEYFKIWIVNVLLTIVTVGIYAAWAKVRKRRYFYANTKLCGHSFEYLADPVRILIGNIIVVVLFFIYSLSSVVSPVLPLLIMLMVMVAVPWFIVRSFIFNARNTAWRGLRFQFHGRYFEALKAFVLWPFLLPFTLGLIWPQVIRRQKEFLINNHAFGTTRFQFSCLIEDLYGIFFRSILFFLPLICAYGLIITSIIMGGGPRAGQPPAGAAAGVSAVGGLIFMVGLPLAIAGSFYLRSRLFNCVWNQTSLGGHQFSAHMRARDLFFIHFVNSLVTMFTLGLLHPWAVCRMVEFQLSKVHIISGGNMDQFVADAQPPAGSAIGEAAADLLDFDVGFGA